FQDASRDKENKVKSLIERGLIYMNKEKYADAAAEMQRALKNMELNFANRSTILNLRYTLANCYETMHDITNTIVQLEEIKKISPAYKDVPARLAGYEALRMGDEMKDFMTATDEAYLNICKNIVSKKMKRSVSNAELLKRDIVQIIGVDNDKKWLNVKQRPEIIRFYRTSTPVTERELHDVLDFARQRDASKTIILSASSFSQTAMTFAQERPIQLMDKTALASIICEKKNNI
ncbi:MAG: restriction endonuclease, partial [Spirochaetales bacterium]|nr:restriction endonuclease [Spirochaetales bacterium]